MGRLALSSSIIDKHVFATLLQVGLLATWPEILNAVVGESEHNARMPNSGEDEKEGRLRVSMPPRGRENVSNPGQLGSDHQVLGVTRHANRQVRRVVDSG